MATTGKKPLLSWLDGCILSEACNLLLKDLKYCDGTCQRPLLPVSGQGLLGMTEDCFETGTYEKRERAVSCPIT